MLGQERKRVTCGVLLVTGDWVRRESVLRVACYLIQVIGSGEKACDVLLVTGDWVRRESVLRVARYLLQVIGSGEKACYVWHVTCYR